MRSGVLTSVHAFATDPARGVFILLFLAVVVGGSLLLYSWRAPVIRSNTRINMVSREGGILVNNVLLVTAAASVLLGTLYPLLLDALNMGKISVGPPYFNSVFVPLTAPLAMLVGVGAMMRWKGDDISRLSRPLIAGIVISLLIGVLVPVLFLPQVLFGAILGITLAVWVFYTSMLNVYTRISTKSDKIAALLAIPRGYYGMIMAHTGIAVFIVGVTLTSLYSIEKDVRLLAGDSYNIAGYDFEFKGVSDKTGPNYKASQGDFVVSKGGEFVTWLHSQKRLYNAGGMPMTEAGIDPGLFRDLYVSLGEQLDQSKDAWSVRLYHKPFIRWIWLGALFMAFGGILAASDRRYRVKARNEQASAITAGAV